jgi:formate hydrogenlyase transcriptional activator
MSADSQHTSADTLPQQYRTLLEIADTITAHQDLNSLLQDLTERLRPVVASDAMNVVLYDEARHVMRLHNLVSSRPLLTDLIPELPIEEAPAGWVWETQQPWLMNNVAEIETRYARIAVELRAFGIQSAYALPLTVSGRRLGVLGFGSRNEAAYNQQQQAFLQQVAKLVAVALDNTLNFASARKAETAAKRQAEELQLLLEINNAVVSQLELKELLHIVSAKLREVLDTDSVGVGLFDQTSGELRIFAADYPTGHPFREEGVVLPLEGSPSGLAFTSGQPVFMDSPDLVRFPATLVRQIYERGYQSGGSIPLIAQGRKLGVLGVASKRENAFSANDKALLIQVANQVAIAVHNALNFERARTADRELARKLEHVRLMLKITNAVVSQLDLQELLQIIAASMREVMGSDIGGVALFDHETNQLRAFVTDVPVGHPLREKGLPIALEGSPSGLAFTSGQPVFLDKPDLDRFTGDLYKRIVADGYLSGARIPLITQGRRLGILSVDCQRENAFSDDDKELLCQIANQVAIAVDNALNFERARIAEQEIKRQLERERLMLEINNAVVSQLDLRALARVTATRLREVLQHDVTGISLYDQETKQFRAYMFDLPGNLPPIPEGTLMPLEGTVGGLAFHSGRPVFLNRYEPEFLASEFDRRLMDAGIRSGGVVPLIAHGKKLGFLGVGSFREDAFSAADQELLGHIANQIAIAVENALNFERARKAEQQATHQSDRLSTVLQINNAVVSQLDLHELLQVISRTLRKTIHNDTTGVALYEPESKKLRVVMTDFPEQMTLVEESYLIELEGSAMGVAYTSGEPVFLDQFDLERFPSDFTRRSYEAGLRSACNIPLIAHGHKLGALGVASKRPFAFSAEDRELLCQSAKQIAIAVENALNFERAQAAEEQAKQQTEQTQLLLQVNNAIASALDLRSLFRAVSDCLRQVFRHDYAVMGLYNEQEDILRVHLLDRGEGEGINILQEGQIATLVDTPVGLAIRTKQVVVTGPDYLKEFPAEVVQRAVSQGIRANCSAPLLRNNRVIGAMSIASKTECAFTQEDGELFMQIAGQVAIAVENALNFSRAHAAEEEATRQSQRRQLLLEINNAMVAQLDLRSLIQIISASLRRISRHDVVGLALYDPATNQLRAYAYDSLDKQFAIEEGTLIPLESSLSGTAFTTGQPIFHDRIDEGRFQSDFSKRFRAAGLKSGGVVPLIAHGRKLGTLAVASYPEANLNEDEKELLCQVANQVALAVENALAFREIETLKNKLTSEKLYLEDEIRTQNNFEELIGESQTFRRVLKQVETVAPTDSTVLIRGETGTGKELIARAIHHLSTRRERTLVKINCAAIPTGLLESELFGHEKGAFTGAIAQRIGRFELAHHGTLLLDEVGDIPLELQSKLLRVLQEQEFERLGSTRTQRVDVRLIAATNCDLEQMVAERKYRSDLFYRLNVFPITIPPLRQRREDIPALTRFFTQKYARRLKKPITAIPAEAMAALTAYHWPGNVRELEHFVERAVILTRGAELEVSLTELKTAEPVNTAPLPTLESAEREHILRALEETNWIIGGPNGAAAKLGMKRTTLQSRMQKLGITRVV